MVYVTRRVEQLVYEFTPLGRRLGGGEIVDFARDRDAPVKVEHGSAKELGVIGLGSRNNTVLLQLAVQVFVDLRGQRVWVGRGLLQFGGPFGGERRRTNQSQSRGQKPGQVSSHSLGLLKKTARGMAAAGDSDTIDSSFIICSPLRRAWLLAAAHPTHGRRRDRPRRTQSCRRARIA